MEPIAPDRETQVTPLPPRFPASRLWLMLALVALLALAALLSVFRPWGDEAPRTSGARAPLDAPALRAA